jgi:DNA-binding GntR family transcriptional regulator
MSLKPQNAMDTVLPSLSRQRLADQIADVLRNQILQEVLEPGTNIPERETADALGVSRTPLREALLILEAEGLVEMAPARSPIVANPSLDELTHLLLVQSALEALAGETACDFITDDEFADIEAMHQEMVDTSETADSLDFFSTDMAFHSAIVASTKNLSLIKTHSQYNSRLWRARYMSSRRKLNRPSSMSDHAEIVEGLRTRDKEKTANAMRRHLRRAIVRISGILTNEKPE